MRIAGILAGALALAFAVESSAATRTLDAATLGAVEHLDVGAMLVVDAFPIGAGRSTTMTFRRIDVYAPGARILAVDASGEHELARSTRIELVGRSSDGTVRASLAFDAGGADLAGSVQSPSGPFAIRGTRSARGVELVAVPAEDLLPPGVVPRIEGGNDALPSGQPFPSALEIALTAMPEGATRSAIVAVDTDNEFMSERFSNSTAAASAWIADLFATMNVMYERDLAVTLLQGTTYLRTTTDPYSANGTPADQTDLTEFGTYWQTHYASVSRSFAMLLSGKASSQNSASGIAWINAYCRTQSQGGSYSVNQVFTNPQIGVGLSALIVGHELGHNFGAYHTHCTNVTSGAAPTGTNTIDRCYSGESSCYSGATSCPTSGPGAPAGTIMSYCNLMQCGSSGQNVLQFHPTQIGTLNALIAANTPSCLAEGVDRIFANGFD